MTSSESETMFLVRQQNTLKAKSNNNMTHDKENTGIDLRSLFRLITHYYNYCSQCKLPDCNNI